jgi:hypothetical protein
MVSRNASQSFMNEKCFPMLHERRQKHATAQGNYFEGNVLQINIRSFSFCAIDPFLELFDYIPDKLRAPLCGPDLSLLARIFGHPSRTTSNKEITENIRTQIMP